MKKNYLGRKLKKFMLPPSSSHLDTGCRKGTAYHMDYKIRNNSSWSSLLDAGRLDNRSPHLVLPSHTPSQLRPSWDVTLRIQWCSPQQFFGYVFFPHFLTFFKVSKIIYFSFSPVHFPSRQFTSHTSQFTSRLAN